MYFVREIVWCASPHSVGRVVLECSVSSLQWFWDELRTRLIDCTLRAPKATWWLPPLFRRDFQPCQPVLLPVSFPCWCRGRPEWCRGPMGEGSECRWRSLRGIGAIPWVSSAPQGRADLLHVVLGTEPVGLMRTKLIAMRDDERWWKKECTEQIVQFVGMNILGSCVYGWLPLKSFHLKYGWQLIQTTVPTTARNELQNHEIVWYWHFGWSVLISGVYRSTRAYLTKSVTIRSKILILIS
jgi:hypothetical protein